MRTLSDAMRAAQNAQETGDVIAVLLTIDHDELDEPIRVSSDPTVRTSVDPLTYGTSSRGNTYLFLPFEIALPDDQDRAAPRAQIRIDNIGRELIELIRSTPTPPAVLIEVIRAAAPDVVEASFPDFLMSGVTYDAREVRAELTIDSLMQEPFPALHAVPSIAPALHNRQT